LTRFGVAVHIFPSLAATLRKLVVEQRFQKYWTALNALRNWNRQGRPNRPSLNLEKIKRDYNEPIEPTGYYLDWANDIVKPKIPMPDSLKTYLDRAFFKDIPADFDQVPMFKELINAPR
jgi:hypothetical protein